MTAPEEITARLLLGGVAGAHCSHSREDNVLKASQLASGDPDATFGMADLASVLIALEHKHHTDVLDQAFLGP